MSSRRGDVDWEEDAEDAVDVDAAEDGREVDAAAVSDGDEQRESTASDAVEASEANDEWRVMAAMLDRGVAVSDTLSGEEMAEGSSGTIAAPAAKVESTLIATG